MELTKKIILASGSPRRKELLEDLDLDFVIRLIEVDESYDENMPAVEVAEFLARKKASAYAPAENELIITADTIVLFQNKILGKPKSLQEAKETIKALSGTDHIVISGVCLKTVENTISFSNTSKVFFRDISDTEIDYYVEKYKPLDKAGSYGIQEWIGRGFIEKIEGSYTNIMGLPTAQLMRELGVSC